ncbi:MAG: PAS domain S-box protein [Bacteroidota bacterium]
MNRNPVEFTHPDDLNFVLATLGRLIEDPTYFPTIEYRFKDKTGIWKWVESTFSNLLDESSVQSIVINFREITARKEAEELSRKLSTAVEHSGASVIITDANGNIEYVNPKFTKVSGYSYQEAIGNNPRLLKSGLTAGAEYAKLWKVISSGKVWSGELCNRTKSGDLYWESVSISPIIDNNGITTHFVAVKEDITDRKFIEDELFASEEKYRTIFENVQDVFYKIDLNGIIIDISPSVNYFSEFNRLELLNSSVFNLYLNEGDRNVFLEEIKKKGEVRDYELKIQTKTGVVKDVSVNARLVFDKEGNPKFIDGAIRDITLRKKAEEKLAEHDRLLLELNMFSIELSMMSAEDNLEEFIAKRLKNISGAELAMFSSYDSSSQILTTRRIEIDPIYYAEIVRLLGKQVNEIHTFIKDDIYQGIVKNTIGLRKKLHEASFGAISRSLGNAIQELLHVDRFIGVAYLIEGKLFGTSLLGMRKGHPDPPREILENFIHIAALSIRRNLAEVELKNSYEKLRLLTQHVEEVREEERIAISRELHDDLGQSLTAVKMDLGIIKNHATDEETALKIAKVSNLIGDTIRTVQKLTAQLRPQIIEDLGIEAAIESYTNEFAHRTGAEVILKLNLDKTIAFDVSFVVYRILQESLTNIARHAKATRVEIKLNQTVEGFYLMVVDNGIGITLDKINAKDSFGIISMKERTASLGGTFEIGSGEKFGTVLKFFLPLHKI